MFCRLRSDSAVIVFHLYSRNDMWFIPEIPCYIHSAQSLYPSGKVEGDAARVITEEPDYKSVITDANLRRRMGRLLKMSMYCGLKSLDGIESDDVAGIITSTGMGFMKDTVVFGNSIFDRDEDMLNPSPFMQSTFNTVSGYLALMRKIRAYNTTYVHGAGGFAAALADASMLLTESASGLQNPENQSKSVLVGAFDEVTAEVDTLRRMLLGDDCLPLGEGACSFLLSLSPSDIHLNSFGLTSCDNDLPEDVFFCSSYVDEMGAFPSMLPVLLCRLISEGSIKPGVFAIVDDVNPGGYTLLLEKQ